MFASALKLQYQPLQLCNLKAVQAPIAVCSGSGSMLLDRGQTAPFHINYNNQNAATSSDRGESSQRVGKLEVLWRNKSRRKLWSIRTMASSADGFPASNSDYSTPKSDEEWCEILFPSKDPANSSVDLTNERVDRKLASSPPSGNAGVEAAQMTVESTQLQPGRTHSTALPPSTETFDASSDAMIHTQMGEVESKMARLIVDFRFLAMMAVVGFLAASCICFVQGCVLVCESYAAYYTLCIKGVHTGKVVLYLIEALDQFLAGTVMLILGMGLYGLFISNVPLNLPPSEDRALQNSSLFGLFYLKERPKWMRISSLDTLKSKMGHLIVMILLVKMFERSRAISISTGADLFSYAISIFLSSAALFVLNKLQ